jgi:hypothetical protein
MAHPLARLATRIFGTPLLIQPDKLEVILSAVGSRFVIDGYPVAVPALAGDSEGLERKSFSITPDGIAVIDVAGSLVVLANFEVADKLGVAFLPSIPMVAIFRWS